MMRIERVTIIVGALLVACNGGSDQDAGADAADDVAADAADASAAETSTGDAALGAPCDPLTQNCADPADKCTFAKGDAGYGAVCVAPTDYQFTVPNDQPCARTAPGNDDCVKGQICIPNGASGQFTCWSACAKDADCATNEKCVAVTSTKPYYGACEPSCALFGTDCPNGMSCGGFYLDNDGVDTAVVCHGIGGAGANASCSTIWDCGANLTCLGGRCLPDCDSAHTCTTGTCTTQKGIPDGGGTCQ